MQDEQHSYAASKRELKDAANQARIEGKHQYADELELLLYERGRGDRWVPNLKHAIDFHHIAVAPGHLGLLARSAPTVLLKYM